MKTLIIYYSYSGKTKKIAEELAAKEPDDILEVKDIKRPGKFKAYTAGCFAALRGKAWPIRPLDVDLSDYDRLILFAPVWAGNPAPAMGAVLKQLPEGKSITVKMVSASGKSECKDKLEALIKAKGCTMESFEDIKA